MVHLWKKTQLAFLVIDPNQYVMLTMRGLIFYRIENVTTREGAY